jgi:hypothetical protein
MRVFSKAAYLRINALKRLAEKLDSFGNCPLHISAALASKRLSTHAVDKVVHKALDTPQKWRQIRSLPRLPKNYTTYFIHFNQMIMNFSLGEFP